MTKVYILSQTNARDLIEWLRQGHVNRVGAALENLLLVDDPRTVNAELLETLRLAEESLGAFVSDHGWSQRDMENFDSVCAALAKLEQGALAQPANKDVILAALQAYQCSENVDEDGEQDQEELLEILAHRARCFPNYPMGYHMPELFAALGEEPPQPASAGHDSDCAMHNAPAYPPGACDCTLAQPVQPALSKETK